MSVLAKRLLAIHDALSSARVPHAFGGAIALAYCTIEAIVDAGAADIPRTSALVASILGPEDPTVRRLTALAG